MSTRVSAPFTEEQCKSINEFQQSGFWHPFTCNNITFHDGDRNLVAVPDHLGCPNCSYKQYWVHGFMADGSWKQVSNVRDWLRDSGRGLRC